MVYYDGDEFRTGRITNVSSDTNDGYIAVIDDGQIIGLCITEDDGQQEEETEVPEGAVANVISGGDLDIYLYGVSSLTDAEVRSYLLSEGYSEISKTGSTWNFTYEGMPYTGMTVDFETAYKVTLTTSDSNVTVSPSVVYIGNGSSAEVSVTNGYANWDSIRTWTGSGITCGTATGTGRVQSFTITGSFLSGDTTITLSWN